jgi:hypothetical protein
VRISEATRAHWAIHGRISERASIWTDTADRTLFYASTTASQTCGKMQDWRRQDSGNAD